MEPPKRVFLDHCRRLKAHTKVLITAVVIAVNPSRSGGSEHLVTVDDTTALAKIIGIPSKPNTGDLIDILGEYLSVSRDFVVIRGLRMAVLNDPNYEVTKFMEAIRTDRIQNQVTQLKDEERKLREFLQGKTASDLRDCTDAPPVTPKGAGFMTCWSLPLSL